MQRPTLILTFLTSVVAFAADRDPVLESYIRLALLQSPVIAAAEFDRDAAAAGISAAALLQDPMLTVGLKEYPLKSEPNLPLDKFQRTGKWIGIEQNIPFPGTRGAAKEVARQDWRVRSASSHAERSLLVLEIKMAYYEWAGLRAEIELVEQSRELLATMHEQAVSAFSAGVGSLAEVLRIETDLNTMSAELANLGAMERTAIATINLSCALPPDSVSRPPLALSFLAFDVPRDTLEARMTGNNPEYAAAEFQVAMAEAELQMSRRDRYPIFRLGGEYMRRGEAHQTEEMDMLSVMGGVTLPIFSWKTGRHTIDSRAISLKRASEIREVKLNSLRLALTREFAKQRSISEQHDLYVNDIIPSGEKTHEAALSAYSTGGVDLMTALNALKTLLEFRRTEVQLTAEYMTVWSRLEQLSGERLF